MSTQSSAKDTKSVSDALSTAEKNINKAKPAPKKVASKEPSDAELLKAFVNKNGLALTKNGKNYLLAEAWQFVARLKGITPSFESASEIVSTADREGKELRYLMVTTTCVLKDKDLREVSRSTIVATSLESFLKDKPAYAVWGMSETRALSRAIRNIYGYIARDAGYQATPWEEID